MDKQIHKEKYCCGEKCLCGNTTFDVGNLSIESLVLLLFSQDNLKDECKKMKTTKLRNRVSYSSRKYTSQSGRLFMVCSDQLCLLLHES